LPLGAAQDHKRVGDGDTGPNTGGMGAYSPPPIFTDALQEDVMARIIRPVLAEMARRGAPFKGVLFAGLMITAEGPKLIEFNVRFGDPECQVLMTRFDGDLAALMLAVATGTLAQAEAPAFSRQAALTIVMAANGYPALPEKGGVIHLADVTGAKIFHAGTAEVGGQLVASGGRVLNVTATGDTVTHAQAVAYAAVDSIDFPGGFCRRDIGWREVARERASGTD
jgi:phosphoribosylamine--glycine ligase